MSNAWQTNSEDVLTVLANNGIQVDVDMEEWKIDEIVSELDHELIEASALYGHSIEEQVQFAYEEIESQLKKKGVLV